MEPTYSRNSTIDHSRPDPLSRPLQKILCRVARQSISLGIEESRPLMVDVSQYPHELQQPRASFVTLYIKGTLRGCMGSLEAYRPLIEDVAYTAFAAAFRDPRFPPVREEELPQIEIAISVLSRPEKMEFDSEADLLKKIRPGIDGLILREGYLTGTFLPSVWETISDPVEFLKHLKMKANLRPGYWSDTLEVHRYTTQSFRESAVLLGD